MLLISAEISQEEESSAPTSFQTGGRTIPSCPPGQVASEKTSTMKRGVNVPCGRNLSKRRNRKDTERNASGPSGKTPPLPRSPRQSLPANIFHFTEIRNCSIHRSSRPRERGDRTSSRTRARVRWTRLRRARGAGPGRDEPREVSQRAERTAPTSGEASWRSRKLRTAKPCGPDRRCYGQALRRCISAQPGLEASSIREVTEARRNSAPGRAGISRQTTAQGRPCVGLHLYAAVQFSACAVAQRTVGASRHPAFPAPSS
ncbi:hypothetical protein ABIE73_002579 [Bradyrhizobium yuanmingense]